MVYEIYVEQYNTDDDFEENFESLTHNAQIERVKVIREIHLSRIAEYFGVSKTMTQSQMYCYWPHMYEKIVNYIKGCVMCSIGRPCNRKIGLHIPLPVPLKPWGNMDLVQG